MKYAIVRKLVLTLFLLTTTTALSAISYSADVTNLRKEFDTQIISLEGNAHLQMPGFEAFAEHIEVRGTQGEVVQFLTPTLFLVQGGNTTIYAAEATYVHDNQVLEITTWARIVDNELAISAQSNYAHIQIQTLHVRMIGETTIYQYEENLVASADTGTFADNVITLRGNTQVTSDNDTYTGEELVMNLDTNYFKLSDKVTGIIIEQGEEANE